MFWSRHFFVGGILQIADPFYKSGSLPNMWQNLVTIGHASSKIRRQKKKERTRAKYNGCQPASWCTAMIKRIFANDMCSHKKYETQNTC